MDKADNRNELAKLQKFDGESKSQQSKVAYQNIWTKYLEDNTTRMYRTIYLNAKVQNKHKAIFTTMTQSSAAVLEKNGAEPRRGTSEFIYKMFTTSLCPRT